MLVLALRLDLVMGDTRKFFHDCNYILRRLFFDNIRTYSTLAPCQQEVNQKEVRGMQGSGPAIALVSNRVVPHL